MTSDQAGVAVFVVWTVALVAVPVTTIVVAVRRRRHVGGGLVAVTVLAFAVLGVGWWSVLSPVVVDGTTCMSGSAAAGLLDDSLDMTDEAVALAARQACRVLSRQVVGGWALAAAAALAVWLVAVARAPHPAVPGPPTGARAA
ncbi:hypothetical protein [Krasilnikoviella flava]|uniref:Uncharacterized protein n=1 Tax=Krasilnikoviella flava TaxID=526729 RepID=A0A1T5M0E9_9MICO|nr:hypothetical protein [Krasilnikoviella flava]SKC81603.1 hypothetical protein SAMN04324258_4262 [Krasilnikoviella flava]